MAKAPAENLRYPIGVFIAPSRITQRQLEKWISEIEDFPFQISNLTHALTEEQLCWKYRENGWSIRQVVHHCADSHMNSFIRFKLCLTEDLPTIRPYFEDRWAVLEDAVDNQIGPSLELIKALHYKWVLLLRSLSDSQFDRQFLHPESGRTFSLRETVGNYAWHGNHHLAHIRQALCNQKSFHEVN